MNKHTCDQCDGSDIGHKLSWVHGRDSQECCFCNPKLKAIPSISTEEIKHGT